MKWAILLSTFLTAPAFAQQCIDDELVLIADASQSMLGRAYDIQREGYAHAFRSGAVIEQIRAGACGALAVSYVEFASSPETVVGWTIIETDEDAEAFAAAIEAAPKPLIGDMTNISAAMEYAVQSIRSNGIDGLRRIVDVSTDGVATLGDHPSATRDKYGSRAVHWAERVIFNGLPIVRRDVDRKKIEAYFEEFIVGFGGRLFPAASLDNFSEAVTAKIAQELG